MHNPLVLPVVVAAAGALAQDRRIDVSANAADIETGEPLSGFLSYAIEFSSFPDFAGNKTIPNGFSNNLLNNIGKLQGIKPFIRVGGKTQDYAIYNPDLKTATNGTIDPQRSRDYPTTLEIGPSFFESYATWPQVKFSHGFNMGGNNDPRARDSLMQTVPLACNALRNENLYLWEYGNEPDLYATSDQGPVRARGQYDERQYVNEWHNGTATIAALLQTHCPELLASTTYGYLGPSFAGTNNYLQAQVAWTDGLNKDSTIKLFSSHNFIDRATTPGVTLQGTLMNHTRTTMSIDAHVAEHSAIDPGLAHVLTETNSLSDQGKAGLSNTFGAALWSIDFSLYCAAKNIRRLHMHMGTDFRYSSWQPVETENTTVGTKAPYYADIAVAAFLGNLQVEPVRVAHVPLGGDGREAAYAAYVNNVLARLMIINMNTYNYTEDGVGPHLNCDPRHTRTYSFNVGNGTTATIQRLYANGSDAITGISWDAWTYNYDIDKGRPVRLTNVSTGEVGDVRDGKLKIAVPDSQAVMVNIFTQGR